MAFAERMSMRKQPEEDRRDADVVLGDDASRIKKGDAAAIMTSIRHLCMKNTYSQEVLMITIKLV